MKGCVKMHTNETTAPATARSMNLPFRRKVTYAFTDLSGNLLYCIISSYALYYFTEVYGLSVGAAGTILLVARFFDGFDAPIWGIIIDHTRTKWGQSRPWFLWMAAPFALFVWLLFTVPPISDPTARTIYAGVIYVLAGISYTGMSTPITSVLPNLTSDTNDRTVANTFRMVGGNIGNFFAVTFILPLATKIGGASNSRFGWSVGVGIYAVIAVVLLVIAFVDMREQNITKIKPITIRESFKAAKRNWPWMLIVLANCIFWMGLTARTSTLPYFAQYNLNNKNLISTLNGISIIQVVGMAAVPFLVRYMHKFGSTIFGFAVAIVGQIGLAVSTGNLALFIVFWCVSCIGTGIACSLFFEMVGDTVDFGEWRNNVRASGFLTAIGSSFCIKMGAGIGAFIPAQIMNAFGYVDNKAQTATSLSGIEFSFIWVPLIIFALGILPMVIYRYFERNESKVTADLKACHAIGA